MMVIQRDFLKREVVESQRWFGSTGWSLVVSLQRRWLLHCSWRTRFVVHTDILSSPVFPNFDRNFPSIVVNVSFFHTFVDVLLSESSHSSEDLFEKPPGNRNR
ncbi:hypothetical protein RvY_12759 [Ramazzottius varieornatus]|uniref:Uncharacterized protein n=1 Tax=Ramazzottius varieornatus TaxID=947166 RepID=A0A1D1VKL9_RAMVA|nr:hypothetical protein RvY_12759 [Ramazzottius varieornatus]